MSLFDAITQWDVSVLWAVQCIKCAFLDTLMTVLSYMGEKGAVWVILGLGLLIPKKTRPTGAMVLCAMLMGLLLGEIGLKNIVCRPRPFVTFPELPMNIPAPSGFSFPSGHTSSSFAAASVIAIRHKKFAIPALLLAALIAFSRLYNCVHYPTDVICGALFGLALAAVTCAVFKRLGWDEVLSKGTIRKKGEIK